MVTIIVPVNEAEAFFALLKRIESALAATAHEIIGVYGDDAETLEATDAMPERPRTLRMVRRSNTTDLATGIGVAAGDVIAYVGDAAEPVEEIGAMAEILRRERCAIVVASVPRAKGQLGLMEWILAAVGGMEIWNARPGDFAFTVCRFSRPGG